MICDYFDMLLLFMIVIMIFIEYIESSIVAFTMRISVGYLPLQLLQLCGLYVCTDCKFFTVTSTMIIVKKAVIVAVYILITCVKIITVIFTIHLLFIEYDSLRFHVKLLCSLCMNYAVYQRDA